MAVRTSILQPTILALSIVVLLGVVVCVFDACNSCSPVDVMISIMSGSTKSAPADTMQHSSDPGALMPAASMSEPMDELADAHMDDHGDCDDETDAERAEEQIREIHMTQGEIRTDLAAMETIIESIE